jgi:hypothetical protein
VGEAHPTVADLGLAQPVGHRRRLHGDLTADAQVGDADPAAAKVAAIDDLAVVSNSAPATP